jgi:hypothetical protein
LERIESACCAWMHVLKRRNIPTDSWIFMARSFRDYRGTDHQIKINFLSKKNNFRVRGRVSKWNHLDIFIFIFFNCNNDNRLRNWRKSEIFQNIFPQETWILPFLPIPGWVFCEAPGLISKIYYGRVDRNAKTGIRQLENI